MKHRAPAFQFYPRQFAGDDQVGGMDLEAVGAHILLMCAAAASPEGYRINADEYAIRMRLRNPSEEAWQRIKSQLLAGPWKLSADGKWWEQDGLRRTLEKQKTFSESQRGRARSRWDKSDAGSVPDGCRNDAGSVPEVCSSSSSSSSNKNLMSEAPASHEETASRRNGKPITDAGLRLAALLRSEILKNEPKAKITQAQERKWARTADLMYRKNKNSFRERGADSRCQRSADRRHSESEQAGSCQIGTGRTLMAADLFATQQG